MGFDLKSRAGLHKFTKFMSKEYGIDSKLVEYRRSWAAFPWQFYRAIVTADCESYGSVASHGGASASDDPAKAALGALGEMLERYCLGFSAAHLPRHRQISYRKLRKRENVLPPEEMPLFSETQFRTEGFKCQRWTAELETDWVLGHDLTNDKPIWIPEDFVTYGSPSSIYANTSSSCALGSSLAAAILNATLEGLERDSIMGVWWNKITPPRIDPSTVQDSVSKSILRYFECSGNPMFLIDVTSDLGVPVVITAHHGDQAKFQPAFLMAASAKLTMEEAIRKACLEVFQNSIRGKTLGVKRDFSKEYDKEIFNFDDSVSFHCQAKNLHISKFLLGGATRPCSTANHLFGKSDEESVKKLLSRLERKGYRVLMADLTTRDVQGLGFHAVRTIVPGLIPLNAAHKFRPWGVKRIYEFKKQMKLGNQIVEEKDLYPFPHPFP